MSDGRVVLVDDEEMVTQNLEMLLGMETDYEAVSFNQPASALEYLKQNEADAVLSDFIMPGMSGLDLLAAPREPTVQDVGQCGEDERPADDLAAHPIVPPRQHEQYGHYTHPHDGDRVGQVPEYLVRIRVRAHDGFGPPDPSVIDRSRHGSDDSRSERA